MNGKPKGEVEPRKNKQESTDLLIDFPSGLYFIHLVVTNRVGADVVLKWSSQSGNIREKIISQTPTDNIIMVHLVYKRSEEIRLFSESIKGQKLLVNSNMSVNITSTTDSNRKTFVEITRPFTTFYYTFAVTNELHTPIQLNAAYGMNKQALQLKAKEMGKKQQYVVQQKTNPGILWFHKLTLRFRMMIFLFCN